MEYQFQIKAYHLLAEWILWGLPAISLTKQHILHKHRLLSATTQLEASSCLTPEYLNNPVSSVKENKIVKTSLISMVSHENKIKKSRNCERKKYEMIIKIL